jgi:hypothetical protein
MEWYFKLLVAVVWIILSAATAIVAHKGGFEKDDAIVWGIFFPLAWTLFLGAGLAYLIDEYFIQLIVKLWKD